MINMKSIRKFVLFTGLVFVDFLLCFSQQDTEFSTQPDVSYDTCHNLELMNHYLAITYPDIIPPKYLSTDSISAEDQFIIRNNEIFYRFLSTISGLPTPYNQIPKNICIEGNDWIYCKDHINLVKWYAINMHNVPCEAFLEYYNLINYEVPYPYNGEEWYNYVDRIELYQDSIQRNLKDFEYRYQPNKKDGELLFPWKPNYDKEDLSKIKSLINSTHKITFIIKTR